MSNAAVPRMAERLLETLGADTDFRDTVLGDLAEEFGIRVDWDGPGPARRWYYRESVRVAPYLLRDWWRGLNRSHVSYFGRVVLWASLFLMVWEALLRRGVSALLLFANGVSLDALPPSAGVAALMLSWTLIDGCLAGYVAGRIGRRAPLQSALLVAILWMGLMIGTGWDGVPAWFLALNVSALLTGAIAGGAIPALRSAR